MSKKIKKKKLIHKQKKKYEQNRINRKRKEYVSNKFIKLHIPNEKKTPQQFYGKYHKPQGFTQNYAVISIIPPNPTINERFNHFCYFKFLKEFLFNPDTNHIFFEGNKKLFFKINKFFGRQIESILKRYINYKRNHKGDLKKSFYDNYSKIDKKFKYDNHKLKTDYLVDFVVRFYGSFKTKEIAHKYINSNYNKDYNFEFKILDVGKWIPVIQYNKDFKNSGSLDRSTNKFIKDFHKHQIESRNNTELRKFNRKKLEEDVLLKKESEMEVYGLFADAFFNRVSDGYEEETEQNIIKKELYLLSLQDLIEKKKVELENLKIKEKYDSETLIDYLEIEAESIIKDCDKIKPKFKEILELAKFITASRIEYRKVYDDAKHLLIFLQKEYKIKIVTIEKKVYDIIHIIANDGFNRELEIKKGNKLKETKKNIINKNKIHKSNMVKLYKERVGKMNIFYPKAKKFKDTMLKLLRFGSKYFSSYEKEMSETNDMIVDINKLLVLKAIKIDM